MIDDEPTLPPTGVPDDDLVIGEGYGAFGDYRYQHTSMSVARFAGGWDVVLFAENHSARFQIADAIAGRVVACLANALKSAPEYPRVVDEKGRLDLPPAPSAAPDAAFYSPFPRFPATGESSIVAESAEGRIVLSMSARETKSSIRITMHPAVAGWLFCFLGMTQPGRAGV